MDTKKAKKVIGGVLIATTVIAAIANAFSIEVARREGEEKYVQIDKEVEQLLRSLELKFESRFPDFR